MDENEKVTNLSRERASRFLDALSRDPFVCVVVTRQGEVQIYSKEISEAELSRIKSVLEAIENGE